MYEKFYGFTEKPFQLVPNPRFLFPSNKHQNALNYIEYGLSEGVGFILLTGEIGAGKTITVREILNKIEGNVEVGVISNTNLDSGELLEHILHEFWLESASGSKTKALEAIFQYLIEKYSQRRRVLLVIDEAQNLSDHALEEVRMLSNLQTDDHMLLQIMLVGQPELKKRLHAPELAQLSQRIAVSYHLGALEPEEVKEYIAFRLKKVNGSLDIFEKETFPLIYEASKGIPRIINLLCDTALVYAYADSRSHINKEIMSQVIRDKGGLGLLMNEPLAEGQSIAEKERDNDKHFTRVVTLEEKVADLQLQLSKVSKELAENDTMANDKLVAELRELLQAERVKCDKLIMAYGRLKAIHS